MQLAKGVEWGLHCCLALAWLGDAEPVPTAKLAAVFDLPQPYLNKRLQALVRAGVLSSSPGARGGFRLGRPPEQITLMDVVAAIEGPDDAFRCTEIRQQGAGFGTAAPEFAQPCGIATAMRKAELAWRRELAAQSLADLMATTPPASADRIRRFYARLGTVTG
ncbi:Rrf2 family transcriptional regulator [Streptomyces sp. HSW2009]|uniref:RrF2 family transcriptional regulator n=1 Tax=Streptomyces sp. HSW2009 TaxID=3142890 RepID=UPI0032EEC2D6